MKVLKKLLYAIPIAGIIFASCTDVEKMEIEHIGGFNTMDNEEALETVLLTTDSSPEKELEEKEDIRHIQELIEQLPENQRQVIRLRGIEDCSYEDIEQITGLSSSNIRTLLSLARKLIREKLEKASCHG